MYQVIAGIIVIATLLICFIKPEMHKNFMIYDYSYVIEDNNAVQEKPKVTNTESSIKVVETKTNIKPEVKVAKTEVKTPNKATKQISTTKPEVKVAKTNTDTTKKVEKIVQTTPQKAVQEIKKESVKNDSQSIEETLEEQISWNKWHSRIQNKIMDDVRLPNVPIGVRFIFSFDVDKYGKITKLSSYASPSQYTPYAVQYILPVIRSYQGREILNFPKESKREKTTFNGRFTVSSTARYSRPENYNDIEKVIK